MEQNGTKLPKALIIDDDLSIQMIITKFLEDEFDVVAFSGGLEALAYLQTGSLPDIIIVDLNIPGMGGLEIITQLKQSGFFSAIPVIVLSGEESTASRIKCLDSGADDYVVKPFNPQELGSRIRAILRRTGKLYYN